MSKPHLRLLVRDTGDGAKPTAPAVEKLSDLVTGALSAAVRRSQGPVMLHIESVPAHPADSVISVDLVCRKNSPEQFESILARVRTPRKKSGAALQLAAAALPAFGGTRYVALTTGGSAKCPNAAGLDVTVCFPHRASFIAHNLVSVPHLMLVEQAGAYSQVLRALGVAHRASHSSFKARNVQLRSQPSPAELVEALGTALRHGLPAALYAADLPLHQSARVEHRGGRLGYLDLAISRMATRGQECSTSDLDAVQDFIEQNCDERVAALEWSVLVRSWKAPPELAGGGARDTG